MNLGQPGFTALLKNQHPSQESVSLPLPTPFSGSRSLPPGDAECQAATGSEPSQPRGAGRGRALRAEEVPRSAIGQRLPRGRAGPGARFEVRVQGWSPPEGGLASSSSPRRRLRQGRGRRREGGRAALAHLGGGAELGVDARGREEKGCGCGAASRLVRGARRQRGGTRAAWGSRAARGRPRRFAAAEAAARGRCGRGASHAGGEVAGGCAVPPRAARRQVVGAPPPPGTR